MAGLVRAWIALGVLLGACTVGDVDLSGKGCPCVGGYVCDTAHNLCVPLREAGVDGGADAPSEGGQVPGDSASDASVPPDASAPCPSPDATLADDPYNCGRCGHDCQGGACNAGACQPTVLFDGLSGRVAGLTSDGTNLYWGAGAGVYYGATSGGGVHTIFDVGGAIAVHDVAVDASSVYWTAGDGLFACPKPPSTCPPPPTRLSTTGFALALDPTNVYWSTDMLDGGVFECTKASACDGGATLLALAYTSTLVASSGHVLWTAQGGMYDDLDGAIATLQPNGSGADKAAVYDASLYWSDTFSPGGSLLGCTLGACDAGTLAVIDAGSIASMTADATGAYYLDTSGAVWWFAPSTGQVLLASPTRGDAITVDSSAVYWADFVSTTSFRIMKLAKP